MTRKILVLDTSVLCCLLGVSGKETCGPTENKWDKSRIVRLLSDEKNAIVVLPLATIIETGNHIAQAASRRFDSATEFCEKLKSVADGIIPWAAFSEQAELWSPDNLKRIAASWPREAASGLSIGDTTIKDVAEYYAKSGMLVEIVTGDEGLKAYQPAQPPMIPRRRR